MYPFLLRRRRLFEGDAIRLEDDHVELDAAMARVNARFRLLAHQLNPLLWHDARRHLADEERSFQQVLVGTWIGRKQSSCPRWTPHSRWPNTPRSERRSRNSRRIAT